MHFLLTQYTIAGIVVVGLWLVVRNRSFKLGLVLIATLGLMSWLLTLAPLERPYGLQPGTAISFETALAASGAARGDVLESWVVGLRNPRPAWSLAFYMLSFGNPSRARMILELIAPLTLIFLPIAVFWLLRGSARERTWLALTGAFSAVLASSVPLDAFQPFSMSFHSSFFFSPHRPLSLLLVILSIALAWQSGVRQAVFSGLLLGIVGWLEPILFIWAVLVLLLSSLLLLTQSRNHHQEVPWLNVTIGIVCAIPQMRYWFGEYLLVRYPSSEEINAYRILFKNIFAVTTDMEWIFVLALLALPLLWKRGGKRDHGILTMVIASYLVWIMASVLFHVHSFPEPDVIFYLVRFNVALAAGIGGFELSQRILVHLKYSGCVESRAFALVLFFLIPYSGPFLWRPLQMDPLYYESQQDWDTSVQRLEHWVLEHTAPDAIILTGDDTGEWIAALTGRRVWTAERTLSRNESRVRRRELNRLFTSSNPSKMQDAFEATGASLLIFDRSLRKVYWQFDVDKLDTSGLFQKLHQIGDRYAIYGLR